MFVSTWNSQYLSWADRPGCDPPTECSPVSSASLRTDASPWSARNKTRTLPRICLQHRSEKENISLSSNEFKKYIALYSSCLIWLHPALWYMTIFSHLHKNVGFFPHKTHRELWMVCKIGSFFGVFLNYIYVFILLLSRIGTQLRSVSSFWNRARIVLFNNYKQNNYNKGANGFKGYYICKTNYMYIVITSGLHPQYSLYFNHFVQINPCIWWIQFN